MNTISIKLQGRATTRKTAAVPAATSPAKTFEHHIEAALTCLVLAGAALFAAGLLHIAAPLCELRTAGLDVLYASAGTAVAGSMTVLVRGIFRK